jgi:hypothetical protein
MSSKNNPEMRGRKTELRRIEGREVKPALYINIEDNSRYIAAVFDNGELAMGKNGKPIPYQSV